MPYVHLEKGLYIDDCLCDAAETSGESLTSSSGNYEALPYMHPLSCGKSTQLVASVCLIHEGAFKASRSAASPGPQS